MNAMKGSRKFAQRQRPAILAAAAFALVLGGSALAQPTDCGSKSVAYPAGIYHGCLPTKCMVAWGNNIGGIFEALPPTGDITFPYPAGTIGYTIYLPPDYFTNTTKRYPVIYYLDGVGEDNGPTTALSAMGTVVRTAVNNGMPPFIYVWVEAGQGGMYGDWGTSEPALQYLMDAALDSSATFIIKELIPYIDNTYRTIASRAGRSIEGFSMGGNGCLRFAYEYPEMFSSVVSYACSITPGDMSKGMPNCAKVPETKATNCDYAKCNQARIRGQVAIWLRAGLPGDPGNIYNQLVHSRFLDSLNIPHKIDTIQNAGHEIPILYPIGGLAGLKFHAASWNLSSTSVLPEVNEVASRQSPGPRCFASLSGFGSQNAKDFASMKVFDIRGNCLGTRTALGASRPAPGIRIVQ